MNNRWIQALFLSTAVLVNSVVQAQWTESSTGLDGTSVHALAISPVTPNKLYALSSNRLFERRATTSDFVLFSDDYGSNWHSTALEFPKTSFNQLILSSLSAQTMLGLSIQGIYKSTNGGQDWVNTYPTGSPIQDLKVCPTQKSTMYAFSVYTNELLKSTDEGDNWTTVFSPPPIIGHSSPDDLPSFSEGMPPSFAPPFFSDLGSTQIAIDYNNCDVLYLISENRMGKSVDGGQTWSQLDTSQISVNTYISSITAGLTRDVLFIAWRDAAIGVYRSIDGGASWHPANTGIESVAIENVIADPNHENRLYALGLHGVWKTIDGGDSWQSITRNFQYTRLNSLVIDPVNSERMYLLTNVGVFKSVNGGQTWQSSSRGMHDLAQINHIQTLRSGDDTTLFAATSAGGFKLDSNSPDWQRLTAPVGIMPLADLVSTGQDLWAVATQSKSSDFVTNRVFHSQDGGQQWQTLQVDTPTPTRFTGLSALPGHRVPYLGGMSVDKAPVIYRSLNDELIWQPWVNQLPESLIAQTFLLGVHHLIAKPRVAVNPANPDSLYIDSAYSFNLQGNQTFSPLSGLPASQASGVMAFDPFDASRQYAGLVSADGFYHGFYISEDGGQSWKRTTLVSFDVYAIEIDPEDRNIIYVAYEGGVAKSIDAGESWTAFNKGITSYPSGALAIKGEHIYVGTRRGLMTCSKSACAGYKAATGEVIEFYHPQLNHYFLTASPDEARGVDSGYLGGSGWVRTGESFSTWVSPLGVPPDALEVCRFYAAGANTHFYSLANSECESLRASPDWYWEGNRFFMLEADPQTGCPANSAPVYRLYNNRFQIYNDSNHRYTTKMSIVDEMKAKHWTLEGVAFCSPK